MCEELPVVHCFSVKVNLLIRLSYDVLKEIFYWFV